MYMVAESTGAEIKLLIRSKQTIHFVRFLLCIQLWIQSNTTLSSSIQYNNTAMKQSTQ